MPIYEFKCADCEAEFEELVANPDETKVSCPACEGANTEKMGLSPFASGIGQAGCGGGCGGCSGCH